MIQETVARGFAVAAPGANTDFITDVVWPSSRPCTVVIQCETSTIVNLMLDPVALDEAEVDIGLNANSALVAGAVAAFTVPGIRKGDVLNLQVETDSVIDFWALCEGTVE